MTTTFTIDRDSLSLPPLVITGARASTPSGMWFPEGGIQWPGFTPRYTYAPDSAYVAGRQLLAAVLDQANLPAVVRVAGDSVAQLVARKAELEQAVSQFLYEVTLDIDGATQTWSADYTWPQWAPPTASSRLDLTDRAVLTFPLNPA